MTAALLIIGIPLALYFGLGALADLASHWADKKRG